MVSLCVTSSVVTQYPSIVLEVGYKHEDLELLFFEAASFLNEATHIEYCILFLHNSRAPDLDARLIVCGRISEQRFFNSEEERDEFIDNLTIRIKGNGAKKKRKERKNIVV